MTQFRFYKLLRFVLAMELMTGSGYEAGTKKRQLFQCFLGPDAYIAISRILTDDHIRFSRIGTLRLLDDIQRLQIKTIGIEHTSIVPLACFSSASITVRLCPKRILHQIKVGLLDNVLAANI